MTETALGALVALGVVGMLAGVERRLEQPPAQIARAVLGDPRAEARHVERQFSGFPALTVRHREAGGKDHHAISPSCWVARIGAGRQLDRTGVEHCRFEAEAAS
jgi:hypothetical protein